MQIIISILLFIIGIAIMAVSFKAKKDLAYYIVLTVGIIPFFAAIYFIMPK